MSDLYELHEHPDLAAPILILAIDGWVDAGSGMAIAAQSIVDQSGLTTVATFDPDTFIDYRARRPTLTLADGVNAGLEWPFIELAAGHDLDGNDFLLLHGAEPDARWWTFLGAVRELAVEFGVTKVITIGAYPAAVPHTRPTRLTITATADALIDPEHVVPGRIELPAGIAPAIEQALADEGIPAIGLWAQVPHYAATLPYPAAAAALISALAERGPARFEAGELADAAAGSIDQLDDLVGRNDERHHMVEELELLHDQTEVASDLPSGDELAAEFQRFLRDQDRDK